MAFGTVASLSERGRARPSTASGNNQPQSGSRRKLSRQCQFCEKTFSKTEHLLRHERSHTKERPFRCEGCNRRYSRHDTLLRHVKSHGPATPQTWHENNPPSTAVVSRMPEGLRLNDYSNSTDTDIGEYEQQESTARDWNGQSQSLQVRSQAASTPVSGEQLLNSDHFTTDQSQGTRNFYVAPGSHDSGIEMPQVQTPFSLPISATNEESPPFANNNWDASLTCPPWLIGYDFDLDALNTSVSTTLEISQPLFQSRLEFQDIQQILKDQPSLTTEIQRRRKTGADKVQASWFTQIEHDSNEDDTRGGTNTGQMTPVTAGNQYDIGDNFRSRITARLNAPTNDDPLPSTKFLNLSVHVYFTKFNHIFPVIHGQTFRPGPKNSLLLLSITSIGSLLLGSRAAAAQGTRIFERLNKAILASWEQSLHDPQEAESMIKAALIGQTFGLLSGVPKHLAIVEAFHGTIIAWARRCKLFMHSTEDLDITNLSGEELHKAWNVWARSEEIVRTVHGLYIHDAMLSRMFHHAPLLRHDAITVPPAADDDLFNAPTATAWKRLMLTQSFPKPALNECLHVNIYSHHASQPALEELCLKQSRETAYVVLNGISALICEKQQMGQLAPNSTNFAMYFEALICWYFTFASSDGQTNKNDTIQSDSLLHMIRVLWHTVFMELVTDFDSLERAVGRDGPDNRTAEQDLVYAHQWANSKNAQRCILHARALLYSLGAMRLDAEPAIHIPHCLFLVGIASYSYTNFRRSKNTAFQNGSFQTESIPGIGAAPEFPEFSQFKIPIPKHLFDTSRNASKAQDSSHSGITAERDASNLEDRSRPDLDVGSGILFTVIDLLQRIGHWGVARKYAATLSALAKNNGDEDWMLI